MIDLDELEKLAKAATPGPWEMSIDLDDSVNIYHDSEVRMWIADTGQARVAGDVSTAEFIAAANPKVILALIERVRRVEAERDAALELMNQHKCGENVEAAYRRAVDAEARIAEAAKLHRRDSPGLGGEWCQSDGLKWPCPTAVALGLNEGENE